MPRVGSPATDTDPVQVVSEAEERFDRIRRTVSLFVGPVLFGVVLLVPLSGVSSEARRLAAVRAWVLAWWVGEPIPIPATALLGPVLCVLLGIGEPTAVF